MRLAGARDAVALASRRAGAVNAEVAEVLQVKGNRGVRRVGNSNRHSERNGETRNSPRTIAGCARTRGLKGLLARSLSWSCVTANFHGSHEELAVFATTMPAKQPSRRVLLVCQRSCGALQQPLSTDHGMVTTHGVFQAVHTLGFKRMGVHF